MTEIERIKSEGWLSESFWEEEEKSEWLITREQKELWAILLDLFKEFIRVCDKYDLKWFVSGGTALGTVRHQGFIPWDDDLDVMMPRNDYEKLRTLADEFKNPYFLQWVTRDPASGFSHLMIRNSKTTRFVPSFAFSDFNQGIFFDIFPLDEIPYDKIHEIREEMLPLIMENATRMKQTNPYLTQRHKEQVEKWYNSDHSSVEIYNKIEQLAQQYNGTGTGHVGLVVISPYAPERLTYPSELFDNYTVMKFENLDVRIAEDWDKYLTISYGDYMQLPPKETRGVWHGEDKWILDTPYINYLSDFRKNLSKKNS